MAYSNNISLEFDRRIPRRLIQKIQKISDSPRKPLDIVGSTLTNRTRQQFRKKASPWGSPWAGFKNAPSEKRRGKSGNKPAVLLRDTGRMRNALRYKVRGKAVYVNYGAVSYAKYHQFGTRRMVARPTLPIDKRGVLRLPDPWKRDIQNKLQKYFNAQIKKY